MSEIQNTSIFSLDDVTDEEMQQLVDGGITNFDDGDLVTGTVVKLERDEVLLDIGFKSEGVIPVRELSIRKDANPEDIVALGDEIEALVLQKEDKDGRLILSKKRAEYERSWNRIEEKFNANENVEGEVIEVVKGGLILDIGLRGFLPASLVDLRRVKNLDDYKGTRIEARVIEMDRNRNNVVLSRRVVLEEERRAERSEILTKLKPGMRLKGAVSSIVDFGAFVDLGGIDGLIHISELSWNHVNHPNEVVKVGQEVEVEVLDVDLSRERISLGLKQTTEDPWRSLVKQYPVSALLEGTVTKLVPFGVFVDLGEGIEGLVHISEMARQHVEAPAQVCSVGDKVQVKVMEIDLERRRISLSMKAAAETLGVEVDVKPLEKDESDNAAQTELEGEEHVADETTEASEVSEAFESEGSEVETVDAETAEAEESPAQPEPESSDAESATEDATSEAQPEPETETDAEDAESTETSDEQAEAETEEVPESDEESAED